MVAKWRCDLKSLAVMAGLGLLALERLSRARSNVVFYDDESRAFSECVPGLVTELERLEGELGRSLRFPEYEIAVEAGPYALGLYADAPDNVGQLEFAVVAESEDASTWVVVSSLHVDFSRSVHEVLPVSQVRRKGFGLRLYKILADYAFAHDAAQVVSGSFVHRGTSEQAARLWAGLVRRGWAEEVQPGRYRLPGPFEVEG